MKIRRERIDPAIPLENSFIAYDDLKQDVGSCTVEARHMSMFPECPWQIVISAQDDERALHVLYGAAVARARVLAQEMGVHARVYAEVPVGDEAALSVLEALGFACEDGVSRMYREVTNRPNIKHLPEGCTIVRDFLADAEERKFFLERYNACFGTKYDEEWLDELTGRNDFARILMVSPDDLCGELAVWSEDGAGVIGMIQTAKRWRRRGVATYLLEDARLYFDSLGLDYSRFDVWMQSPGCPELAMHADYSDGDPVILYPFMYV